MLTPQPLLVVVTGRPGSGKTTLAHRLARAIRCPVVSRDQIKEGLINTTGSDDDAAGRTYETFFDTIQLLLDRQVTLVAEAAFQHKLWAPKLEPLRAIARLRIVICQVEPELARARHIDRGLADADRERFHPDEVMRAARLGKTIPIDQYDPPRVDVPTVLVDTATKHGPDLAGILGFVRS